MIISSVAWMSPFAYRMPWLSGSFPPLRSARPRSSWSARWSCRSEHWCAPLAATKWWLRLCETDRWALLRLACKSWRLLLRVIILWGSNFIYLSTKLFSLSCSYRLFRAWMSCCAFLCSSLYLATSVYISSCSLITWSISNIFKILIFTVKSYRKLKISDSSC